MNDLKMELIQLNEAIDMIKEALEMGNDDELVVRLAKLVAERDELIKRIKSLN